MIDWIDRYPPNLTIEMLIAMCIAGGWGWVIGVTPAWMIGRERPAPSNVGRVLALMFVLAVWFVSFGLTSIQLAQHGSFGPMIDGIGARDPLRDRLAVSIAADTALVVTTLVVLAGYTIVRSERRVVPKRPPPDHVENA